MGPNLPGFFRLKSDVNRNSANLQLSKVSATFHSGDLTHSGCIHLIIHHFGIQLCICNYQDSIADNQDKFYFWKLKKNVTQKTKNFGKFWLLLYKKKTTDNTLQV